MSAPIFISYSSKDRPIAETICQALEARGHQCWIACRDVRAGENFQEAIVRALREARVMLLVFSSNANNSDEIKKELVLAGRHHVTVVPARVDDVIPSDAFTYELATRQWIDLFQDWERAIEQLSNQLGDILRSAKPGHEDAAVAVPFPPRRAVPPPKSHRNGMLALAALALLLLIGGTLAYMKPWAQPAATANVAAAAPPPAMAASTPAPAPSAAAPSAAAQSAPPASAPAPQSTPSPSPASITAKTSKHAAHTETAMATAAPTAAAPASAPPPAAAMPAPAPAPAANPDETAWATANAAGTEPAFAEYLKNFSTGVHVQEAQLRLADVILHTPATGAKFDGAWRTSWTCPNLGQYPGYTYEFVGQIKDGIYHGVRGTKGEPSSLVMDGRIEADGMAAFAGEIIVGSSLTGLGAARGTPSDYHAMAAFDGSNGKGKRIEGRPCLLSFERQ
jgi:hypothetical protein